MVRNPVTAQAAMSKAGELTSRAISAETMKMPEPIIEPVTSMVELVRPRPLTNSRSGELSVLATTGLPSTLNRPPGGSSQWLVTGIRPQDFTLECAKIPLLIFGDPVSDRISPQPSPHPPRSPSGSFHGLSRRLPPAPYG